MSFAFRRQAESLRAGAGVALGEAALTLAQDLADGVDAERSRAELDRLGARASDRLSSARGDVERARALLRLLGEEGFRGNTAAYDDPRNSFLDQVLERRVGIPITLSIVAIEVAARAGFQLSGVSFPAHFLVRSAGEPPVVLDPFHGRILSLSECRDRLRAVAGPGAVLEPAMLRPATPAEVMVRMLGNLKHGFARSTDWIGAIDCCDRILLVEPERRTERRDRGLLWARLGFTGPAIEDLERYLTEVPEAPDAERVAAQLARLRTHSVTVH